MKRKLNIVLFPQFTNQSIPMRTQTAEIFGNYLSNKHRIVSIMKSNTHKQIFEWNNITFYNLPFIKFLKKIIELLKKKEFDFLYLRDSFFLLIIAYLIKKKHRIPISIHQINSIKHLAELFHKWYHPKALGGVIVNALHLKLLKKVDLVLPTSEWMGKYLISQGVPADRIYPLPNGANLDFYQLFLEANYIKKFDFIYIGTLAKVRKLEILIEAMKIVSEKYKNASLIMVGTGNDLPNLKALVKSLDLGKNIIFKGQVPYEDVPKYICQSYIGLSPVPPIYMYKVSSPLKMFEYWGCKLPVIANRGIPSHVKAIDQSKGGLLVDYNSQSFASAMMRLKDDATMIKKFGENGRRWVEKNRTYEKLAYDFENEVISRFFTKKEK